MAQWGRNDKAVTANSVTTKETSNGAPIGTYALVKGGLTNHSTNAHFGNTSPGSRAQIDVAMYGNTTIGAFIPGKAVGVFGVDPLEASRPAGVIAEAYVTNPGSGYKANAAVTITVTNGGTSGVVNAHANGTGRIDQLKIQTAGTGYITNPTIAIAAPSLLIFNGNTDVTPNSSIGAFIAYTSASSYLQVGDKVKYAGNVTSTPATLIDGSTYYVSYANSSGVKLANTSGGANINFAKATGDNSTAGGATLQGETATGYVVVGGTHGTGIPHAGWVLRTEGTGGRAGRVQYEVLVAMGSLGQTDSNYGTAATVTDAAGGADNTILS